MDERIQARGSAAGPALLSRRRFLTGVAATGGAAILAACGGTGEATETPRPAGSAAPASPPAATSSTAASSPAGATTAAGSPAAAPSVVSGVTTVTWFSYRDTTGYTPKSVEAFNAQSARIKINYQEQGATTDDLRDKFVLVANAKDATADIVSPDTRPPGGCCHWTRRCRRRSAPHSSRGRWMA